MSRSSGSLRAKTQLPFSDRVRLERERRRRGLTGETPWPEQYRNRDTGRPYTPHHDEERAAVFSDVPRYQLFKGGEGGGKSVAGIVKDLDRLRRGMSGILVSPDLPHFKKSLWPEFRRWCPWEMVIERQRYRGQFDWEPSAPFALAFTNGAVLYCGGMDDPLSWEGPNVSFAHFDEARRAKSALALKVLDGRVRIPGPNGEPPQLWLTTTPRKNWLFEYFGPMRTDAEDPRASFKRDAVVITLLTVDNEVNLEPGFAAKRRQTLTEAEARVLLEAQWEDIEEGEPFLPEMLLWDACMQKLPGLTRREPLVVAMDAATGRKGEASDCFGLLGMTRHPKRQADAVAVRYVQAWQAKAGHKIDFQGTDERPGPERVLRTLAGQYNVMVVCYDPTQLHDMATRLMRDDGIWMKEFPQGNLRITADTDLLTIIRERRLAHNGSPTLRQHVSNADRRLDDSGKKLRIVKREEDLKIDLAVCLSMAAYECLRLNLE